MVNGLSAKLPGTVVVGKDGVSPIVAITDIEGGHRVTITDAAGTKWFDVLDADTNQLDNLQQSIGELSELETEAKWSLVAAINELRKAVGSGSGGSSGDSSQNVTSATLDESTSIASFKNSAGVTLFTLNLSGLGVAATYGNLVLSVDEVTVSEGGTGEFTVCLDAAPSANQSVYLAVSDNSRLSVSPATLTFTPDNYAEPQNVTVTAMQDDDEYDDSVTVTLTSQKVDARQVVVSIGDDDYARLVTDGMVLNFDYSATTDHSSDTIKDTVGGVPLTGWSSVTSGANGVLFSGTALTVDTDSDEWADFVENMKNNDGGFTIEMFANDYGYSFCTKWGTTIASNVCMIPSTWGFDSLAPSVQCFKSDGTTARIAASASGANINYITLPDGSEIWPSSNSAHLAQLPNYENYCHIVICFLADGTVKRYVNGCKFTNDLALSDFASYDFDTMFATFSMTTARGCGDAAWIRSQRIYNRVLTEDEILQNEAYEAAGMGLETF